MRTLKNLLSTPTAELSRLGRLLVFPYRLWSHCLRLLKKNNAPQLAAALSYYTVFGLVPLAIVIVLLFYSIPGYRATGEQLKEILYEELRLTRIEYPDPADPEQTIALTDYLDQVIERFFTGLDRGSLGLVSAVVVIWVALNLLSIIESAFNSIWHVPRGRGFLHRMINYWALLTLVPLLLAAALYATTQYVIWENLGTGVLRALRPLTSFVLSLLALFLVYLVMPNAKVQARAALWGATVAALIWGVARWGFGIYVTRFIPYNTMYGLLGLIPLGIFWIYITWVIVLFGLQLTYTTQHLESLQAPEAAEAQKPAGRFIANDLTVLAVAREIAAAFENDQAPVALEDLCSRLDIPGEFGQQLVEEFVDRGLLAKTTDPREGFTLLRDPAHIRLSDIADAVAAVSFAQPPANTQDSLYRLAQAEHDLLAQRTLKDLLQAPTGSREEPPPLSETPPAEQDSA